MTKFEEFLLSSGYLKFGFDLKSMKYFKPKDHIISTMVNLEYSYIHKSDTNLLEKIELGKSVMDNDFTWEDRKNIIVVGLHEKDKPVTLISPRPRIRIKRKDNRNLEVIEDEKLDDSMNVVISKIEFDRILEAMYDKSICFEIDLTINS
jgi:hypothetical protein